MISNFHIYAYFCICFLNAAYLCMPKRYLVEQKNRQSCDFREESPPIFALLIGKIVSLGKIKYTKPEIKKQITL